MKQDDLLPGDLLEVNDAYTNVYENEHVFSPLIGELSQGSLVMVLGPGIRHGEVWCLSSLGVGMVHMDYFRLEKRRR